MLLNCLNLAWFGDTIAIPQHLQISQMRTLETGRPMLRATNTGATAINGEGTVVQQLPVNQFGTLAARCRAWPAAPHILWGNKLFLLLTACRWQRVVLGAAHKKPAKSRLTRSRKTR
jgi:apolipoprotein N-acyltransferase